MPILPFLMRLQSFLIFKAKARRKNSMDKLIGLLAGVAVIIAIVLWGLFR